MKGLQYFIFSTIRHKKSLFLKTYREAREEGADKGEAHHVWGKHGVPAPLSISSHFIQAGAMRWAPSCPFRKGGNRASGK